VGRGGGEKREGVGVGKRIWREGMMDDVEVLGGEEGLRGGGGKKGGRFEIGGLGDGVGIEVWKRG